MRNNKKTINVVIFSIAIMMSSCVEGDLYDLYEEDVCVDSIIPKTKGWFDDWLQGLLNGHVKDNWLENECGLWAIMVMNNNTQDTKSNRLHHMRKIAHYINPSVDVNNSSERDVCVTYYWQINQGGINNKMLKGALFSLGIKKDIHYKHYYTAIDTQMEDFWNMLGVSPSGNISSLNKVVIVQQEGDPGHYGVLESIYNGEFTLSTHGGQHNTCVLSDIESFFVKL